MHILITNDDGVHAPGLLALAQAIRPLGEVTILAPDRNWSVTGHVKTLTRPLRIKPVTLDDGTSALSTDGAPSDCINLARLGVIEHPIDLVVSGINPTPNLGNDVTYSGTVTAAMEAAIWRIPAIAVSTDHRPEVGYDPAATAACHVAAQVIAHGLPAHTLLNVNVPGLAQPKGYRISRQGLRVYHDQLIERADPRGRPYYWIGGKPPTGVDEHGTDIGDLLAGYVTVTPLHLDLTAHHMVGELQSWRFD